MKKSKISWILLLAALSLAACSNSSGGPDDPDDGGDVDYSAPDMGSPSDIPSPTIPAGITVTAPTSETAGTLLASSMDALSDLFSTDGSADKSLARKTENKTVDLSILSSTGLTVTGSMEGTRDSTELDDHTKNPPNTGDPYYDNITKVAKMDAVIANKDTDAGEDGHFFRISGKEALKIAFDSKEDGTYERIAGPDPSTYTLMVNKGDYTETVKFSFGIAFFVLRDDGLAAKFILSYAASYVDDGSDDDKGEDSGSTSKASRGGEGSDVPSATLSVYNALDNSLIATKTLTGDEVFSLVPEIFTGSEDSESK